MKTVLEPVDKDCGVLHIVWFENVFVLDITSWVIKLL